MGSEDSPKQTCQSNSQPIPEAKQKENTNIFSPICRLSPSYKGSALYDSYELQAVVRQLNRAIQGPKSFSSPPYASNLRSPFRRKQLNRIYRENKSSPKRLTCSNFSSTTTKTLDGKTGSGAWVVTKGVVTRLWTKVKQGLLRSKQKEWARSPRCPLPLMCSFFESLPK